MFKTIHSFYRVNPDLDYQIVGPWSQHFYRILNSAKFKDNKEGPRGII